MSEVLVIQNNRNEGLANLGILLEKDGFEIKTVFAKTEPIPKMEPRFIIILGAPESVNDDLSYLREEILLIREAVERNVPVLGICLGSQLLAKAFGARVYRGQRAENGIYADIEFDNASGSRLFNGIKDPATVFHWHGETFDLPAGAVRLAHSKHYPNQAIKIGSAVGVQFHMEVDENTIRSWLEKSGADLARGPYIDPAEILESVPKKIGIVRENLGLFYRNFKAEFNI